ncbi:Glutamate 5-kinase [Chitinispirillum alkaliphilum]|nr:Glutamate 5-kinase [Chitinispirillum alkaliphilum]
MNKTSLFRKDLSDIKTVVVKTGSRILTTKGQDKRVESLAEDLSLLHKKGVNVILVSSGAIARGMKVLNLQKRPESIPLQQACASIGQNYLMNMYQSYFNSHDILIGQVLLTWDDLRNKKRYLNLRNTLFQLLKCRCIPIVNENDSVGVEEIQFGNNDVLAAQISLLAHADLFVNLTDVNGLYDKNPRCEADARHIPLVSTVSSSVHKLASDIRNELSVGGMATKIKAADMVTKAGIPALIGNGFNSNLLSVLRDENCSTLFMPLEKKMSSRDRWLAFTGQSKGQIVIDQGAATAIRKRGKSLLAAGIIDTIKNFKNGDMVDIVNNEGQIIARGLVNFSSEEVKAIRGCKTAHIREKLGAVRYSEVILRDNMVLV